MRNDESLAGGDVTSVSSAVSGFLLICVMASAQPFLPVTGSQVYRWQKVNWRCLIESLAVTCESVTGRIECLTRASGVKGDRVAQWTASSGICCIFHYQQVCRMQIASTDADQCEVYLYLAKPQLHEFIQSLSDRLVGVWVTSDTGMQFDNLVCSSSDVTRNQIHSSNIAWSSEGAEFNGVNSYMIVNDTEFMNFNEGQTMLIRMKRRMKS
jgi:hypothetical protein